jgi:hypothetical protein
LIVPAWKPELAGPKDIADAIATEWFCDEVLPAPERIDVVRDPQPQRLEAILQSD